MKRAMLVSLIFGLAGAGVVAGPGRGEALAQLVKVQRVYLVESSNLDARGRALSSCCGMYRFSPPARAEMRGACETGDANLLGVPLTLRHNGNPVGSFTIPPNLGFVSIRFRTPAPVPLMTAPGDVIDVVDGAGIVVMTGGWSAP
jgi:hypothetical protein